MVNETNIDTAKKLAELDAREARIRNTVRQPNCPAKIRKASKMFLDAIARERAALLATEEASN